MKPLTWISVSALFAFLGVGLGAFGAHALSSRFGDYEKGIWQTAVFYHLTHALALFAFAVAVAAVPNFYESLGEKMVTVTASLFAVGILIFSGSLYALALTGVRTLGMITPIGGVCFLAAWLSIAWAGFKG
ncbi:MAG: DUF423 domain-containing protein [Cryobacterium sp.]|nr:DUF423 domain-containing protein [Oligoflexia bacterium]